MTLTKHEQRKLDSGEVSGSGLYNMIKNRQRHMHRVSQQQQEAFFQKLNRQLILAEHVEEAEAYNQTPRQNVTPCKTPASTPNATSETNPKT